MMNLSQINTFLEVVHRNSFAGAAKQLGMTPAAISKQIHALEKDLGVQLLVRTTRRLDLTPEGELYYDHAKKIMEAVLEADSALSQTKEEPSGLLNIICGPHFGNQYIIPHLEEFLTTFPKIILKLTLTQQIPDLEKEKIDLIVGLSQRIPLNCIQRRLIFARNVLCASPHYLKRYGTPKTPSDLSTHKIITHALSEPNNVLSFKNEEQIHFEPALYLNDTRAMRQCALNGLGIVELQNYIVDEDLKNKGLIEILTPYREQKKTIPIFVAYPQTHHVNVKVRAFIDFVLKILD